MRLNRGTILLLVLALGVIAAVLVFNNQQANAPDEATPTVTAGAGPLFDELAGNDIARLEVVDNATGNSTLLTQDAGGAWDMAATFSTTRAIDQEKAQTAVGDFVLLEANDSFESQSLGDFGLETPGYVFYADTFDGTRYTLYTGNKNPTGNRYYILLESGETPSDVSAEIDALAAADATSEATSEATAEMTAEVTEEATEESTPEPAADMTEEAIEDSTPEPYAGVQLSLENATVYVVPELTMTSLINLVSVPPYVLPPTAAPTATATLNSMSEVDIATATAEYNATVTALFAELATQSAATLAAEVTDEATVEATAEATEAP